MPGPFELCFMGVLLVICLLIMVRLWIVMPGPSESWRENCRQCNKEWWTDFWRWRLETEDRSSGELLERVPPRGMEWEWAASGKDTDWWGASAELVDSVLLPNVEPGRGPVLHIGCGDSPMPEALHRSGFRAENVDVAPQVVSTLRARYPAADWPGLLFEVRDFLAAGAPRPAHRFAAVVDKAGIWDWLVEEAPHLLPRLLAAVREALVVESPGGVYVVATKQMPLELQRSLTQAAADFVVDSTQQLQSGAGIAWAYVLTPV